jgi:hypothetical protein
LSFSSAVVEPDLTCAFPPPALIESRIPGCRIIVSRVTADSSEKRMVLSQVEVPVRFGRFKKRLKIDRELQKKINNVTEGWNIEI